MAKTSIAVKNPRPLLWVLLAFGAALIGLAIFYWHRNRSLGQANNKKPDQPDQPLDPIPVGTGKLPPVSTPPYVPPVPANSGTGQPTGNNNPYGADKHVEEVSWKANELLEKNDLKYQCDVTTAIAEMPDLQLVALVKNYYAWYDESLPLLFCQKINASACWTSLWDGKAQKACERLKKSAV